MAATAERERLAHTAWRTAAYVPSGAMSASSSLAEAIYALLL